MDRIVGADCRARDDDGAWRGRTLSEVTFGKGTMPDQPVPKTWRHRLGLDSHTKSRSRFTPAAFRCLAIGSAALTWVIGTVIGTQVQGQDLKSATTVAAVGALGGLLAWMVYHTISRQNNGLVIFVWSLVGMNSRHILAWNAALRDRFLMIAILMPICGLCGLLCREARKGDARPADSPLWDAEVDPPCPH